MRKSLEVQTARDELGAQSTALQNNSVFQLELLRTIDDASQRIAAELSDQWDQLKGIAESSRSLESRLEKIEERLFELAGSVKRIAEIVR